MHTPRGGTKRSTAPLGSPSPDLSPSLTLIVGGGGLVRAMYRKTLLFGEGEGGMPCRPALSRLPLGRRLPLAGLTLSQARLPAPKTQSWRHVRNFFCNIWPQIPAQRIDQAHGSQYLISNFKNNMLMRERIFLQCSGRTEDQHTSRNSKSNQGATMLKISEQPCPLKYVLWRRSSPPFLSP